MRLINVKTFQLEEIFGAVIPPYAILSHTWGDDEEEVTFRDVERGRLEKAGNRPIKFEGCCKQAQKDGLKYVWIDTCCIDKTNSVELGEAINSMFEWYRKASICYTYLSDVPSGDNFRDPGSKFFSSRWFHRGWTLQELLAPKQLRFYNLAWALLGTKNEMSATIQKITGIPRPFLLGWAALHDASVAQRMSWAAKRVTKRREDTAYCLLGIFGVMMPMIYGEGNQAFSRLQQEIMKDTREDSILAWGLNPAESLPINSTTVISGGVLAPSPSDFANCGNIVSREQHITPVNIFDVSGGRLRALLPLHTTAAGEIYGLLNCGPEQNSEFVVGIPLNNAVSSGPSDEYIRPQGYCSVLLPKTALSVSTKPIHIWKERQSRANLARSRRYWFYIEESVETNLEIIEVQPRARWHREHAMIATANDLDGNIKQRSLARFRNEGQESYDIVVVLDFEVQGSQIEARCHVMTLFKETTLEDLSQKLIYMRQEAFGKQSASNGILNVYVTVGQESVAGQLMFVVRLAAMPISPEFTVDATLEIRQIDLKCEFLSIIQEEDDVYPEAERLGQQKEVKMATLRPKKERLAEVEEKLEELRLEKILLVDGLEKEAQEVHQLTIRHYEIRQRQDKLSERRLQIQQRLDQLLKIRLNTKMRPENWLETIAEMLLNLGDVEFDLKDIGDSDSDYTRSSRIAESGRNIYDKTLLSWVTADGYDAFVKLVLKKEASVDLKNWAGGALLAWAAMRGYRSVVRLLLEIGAELEAKDKNNRTPLSFAAWYGHLEAVKLLLEKGAELEAKGEDGRTPLLLAAGSGELEVVKLLLEKGAELEARDKDSRTPFLLAARSGQLEVMKLLLEKGAELETKDNDGRTPLLLTAWFGESEGLELLLEKGAELEAKDNASRTPLLLAVISKQIKAVKLLLEKGAKLEVKDEDSRTSLLVAIGTVQLEVVKLLLEKGAELEAKDKNSWTPLLLAAWYGHSEVVKLLLEKGAELEVRDEDGRTPLLLAAWNGHEMVAKLLLEKGAELETKDKNIRTPLSWAAYYGHKAAVELLLEKGAKLEGKDKNGRTPLLRAAYNGHEAVVKLLLEKGAELEAYQKDRRTPLSMAATNGSEAVVKLLLENGAKLEAKDKDGRTPLSWAALRGHTEVVTLLLEKGAQLEAKDMNGKTPLLLAKEKEQHAVMELLVEKDAKES